MELRHVLDTDTFEKARLYQLDSKNFGFWNSLYSQIETTVSSVSDYADHATKLCSS